MKQERKGPEMGNKEMLHFINNAAYPALNPTKSYNIADNNDIVEIKMYGEVVETIPMNWWTGEPEDGLYIVLSDFMNDLDRIRQKKEITVRINSVGGILTAGVSIYNRLKELNNVTTIVDGLAASAASIIAQAASEGNRKIYESSEIMIHGPSIGLCDYFNIQKLEEEMRSLQAANEMVINTYAERTGKAKEELRKLVEQTTWMVGQEAVDNGFADEVIGGKKVTMKMSSDKSLFLCNGIPMDLRKIDSVPRNVEVEDKKNMIQAAKADVNKEGGKTMNEQELRDKNPEAVARIENAVREPQHAKEEKEEAVKNAINKERKRLKEIESIAASIGDKDLIDAAKYGEQPMDAKELAFIAMKNQAEQGNQFLYAAQQDYTDSGAGKIGAFPNAGSQLEEENKDEAADIIKAVNAAKAAVGR